MPDIEYATPIAVNQFPALVLGPDGDDHYDQVRAIVTPSLLVVYGEGDLGGGMREVRTQRVVAIDRMRPDPDQTGYIVTTADGDDWRVRPSRGGCGCGSVLKAMPQPPPVHLPVVYA